MKVANEYPMGEETSRAGRLPMLVPKAPEPADGEGTRGRNRNHNRDNKRKKEQDSELVVVANEASQAGMKKQKWDSKAS